MSVQLEPDPSILAEMVPGPVGRRFRREIIIVAGFGLFVFLLSLDTPTGLTLAGWRAFCLFVITVYLWVSNVIPLAVTSLLAIAGIPLLGILPEAEAYAHFGHKVVFFILGAFILGAALVGSGLSSRLAMLALDRYGDTPKRLILIVYAVGALGSCFVSEHAVAAMLFPLVMSVSRNMDVKTKAGRDFARLLFQSMAWGCIAGGTTTILGGGRGPLAIGILEEMTNDQVTIGFLEYVAFDLPLVILMLFVGYALLSRAKGLDDISIEPARERLRAKLDSRGPISYREMGVGGVMVVTVLAWMIVGDKLGLANIALLATGVLFLAKWAEWRDVEDGVNWSILLMYGGAICLGSALQDAGTTAWLTGWIADSGLSPVAILLTLGFAAMVLTELMSNSAVIAVLLPAALEIGAAKGIDLRVVTMAVVLPSNFAFTFPMATPANALAYSSGFCTVGTMIRRGAIMDMAGYLGFVFLVTVYWPLLGYEMGG